MPNAPPPPPSVPSLSTTEGSGNSNTPAVSLVFGTLALGVAYLSYKYFFMASTRKPNVPPISWEEVRNNAKNNWLVIHNEVYDVSELLLGNDHPGGSLVLLDRVGKDASDKFDEANHSDAAVQWMQNMYVGPLLDSTNVNF